MESGVAPGRLQVQEMLEGSAQCSGEAAVFE
jgi:hypothetical protein